VTGNTFGGRGDYVKCMERNRHGLRLHTNGAISVINMGKLLGFPNRKSASIRFEDLTRPFFDDLHRSARRFTASDSDARDLVQEVCLKAFLNLDELEQMEHKRAWLLRVLYHLFVDTHRSRQRSPDHIAEPIEHDEEPYLSDEAHLQPEQQVDRMLRVEKVLRAMALLDRDLCTLLALHDVDGLSIAELHELTGLSEGTIKSRLFRTREKLGRLLQNERINNPNLRVVGGQS